MSAVSNVGAGAPPAAIVTPQATQNQEKSRVYRVALRVLATIGLIAGAICAPIGIAFDLPVCVLAAFPVGILSAIILPKVINAPPPTPQELAKGKMHLTALRVFAAIGLIGGIAGVVIAPIISLPTLFFSAGAIAIISAIILPQVVVKS